MQPLTEPTLYILLTLAPGPQHGYAIMRETNSLSEGRVKLSTGTLYTALKRLLDEGWIEMVDTDHAPRGRKAYRLTPTGRTMLHHETERMAMLLAIARRKLGETTP